MFVAGNAGQGYKDVRKNPLTKLLPLMLPVQDLVWVVGRVILEAGGEGEQGVLLEGGLEGSEGERVRLDLSAVASVSHGPGCRVFPGQVSTACVCDIVYALAK